MPEDTDLIVRERTSARRAAVLMVDAALGRGTCTPVATHRDVAPALNRILNR